MNQFKTILGRIGHAAKQAQAGQKTAGGGGGSGGSGPSVGGGPVLFLSALGLLGYGGYKSMITIQPGHCGVLYDRISGINETRQLQEGLNIVIPWFQRAYVFDTRTRPQAIDTTSGSKDLQMVSISLKVLYRPNKHNLPKLYRTLGTNYDVRVLPSIVNEITKAIVAQYNAAELLTKREQVSRQIGFMLTKRAKDFDIILEDVAITHLAFSREYTQAVEAKQVAQQDAERAKYVVEKALQEKKSIVIKAEGESESAILIGNAIKNNPAFIELRKIEASKSIAETLIHSGNKVYLNADSLMINTLGSDANKNNPADDKKRGWLA